jgi:hypothetical protein
MSGLLPLIIPCTTISTSPCGTDTDVGIQPIWMKAWHWRLERGVARGTYSTRNGFDLLVSRPVDCAPPLIPKRLHAAIDHVAGFRVARPRLSISAATDAERRHRRYRNSHHAS